MPGNSLLTSLSSSYVDLACSACKGIFLSIIKFLPYGPSHAHGSTAVFTGMNPQILTGGTNLPQKSGFLVSCTTSPC